MINVAFIPPMQSFLRPTTDANASSPLVSSDLAPVRGILWGLALSSLFWTSLGLVIVY